MRRLLLYHDVISGDLDITLVGCGTGGLVAGVGAALNSLDANSVGFMESNHMEVII